MGVRDSVSLTQSSLVSVPFRTRCISTLASEQSTRIAICSRGISSVNTDESCGHARDGAVIPCQFLDDVERTDRHFSQGLQRFPVRPVHHDVEYRFLGHGHGFRNGILLPVAFSGDLLAGADQLPERALFPHDFDICLRVGGYRDGVRDTHQVLRAADAFERAALRQPGVYGHHVDRRMVQVQLLHRREDLPVLRQVEVVGIQQFHSPEHSVAVLQHCAQDADFRFCAVGRHNSARDLRILHVASPSFTWRSAGRPASSLW